MSDRSKNADPPHDPMERLDVSEFAAQIHNVFPRLWLVAAGLVGDRTQAEDIVQEAVLIAFQKRGDFTPGTNFTAWLVQIMRRVAANYLRKVRHRGTHTTDPRTLDATISAAVSSRELPVVTMGSHSLAADHLAFDDLTVRALNQLNDEARCCVLLKIVQQLTYAEIAELLQIPAGTAMSHVYRGKKTMRAFLIKAQAPKNTRSTAHPQ